jgi:hypothetical protein
MDNYPTTPFLPEFPVPENADLTFHQDYTTTYDPVAKKRVRIPMPGYNPISNPWHEGGPLPHSVGQAKQLHLTNLPVSISSSGFLTTPVSPYLPIQKIVPSQQFPNNSSKKGGIRKRKRTAKKVRHHKMRSKKRATARRR